MPPRSPLSKATGQPNRYKVFQCRLTDLEHDRLNRLSEAVGVSMGECVRRLIALGTPAVLANRVR